MEGSWQSQLGKEIELRAAGVTAVILRPTAGKGWSFAVTAAAMSDFLKLLRTYFQSWESVHLAEPGPHCTVTGSVRPWL